MSKVIMGIEVEKRREAVKEVQGLLSEYGCHIKTRIGLHEASEEACSDKGLILLEFVEGKEDMAEELKKKLMAMRHVIVKTMDFN